MTRPLPFAASLSRSAFAWAGSGAESSVPYNRSRARLIFLRLNLFLMVDSQRRLDHNVADGLELRVL